MNSISSKVSKVINIIEAKDLSKKELINYFNNINNYPSISENERERLIEVVEKKMRVNFPNTAKKILGGKSSKARELLDNFFSKLIVDFDWSKNKVGTRVKAGGSMISGKEYVCWYISYKNEKGYSTGLHYRQLTPETDPYLEIDFRKVGKHFENEKKLNKFPVELKDDAFSLFKEYLIQIIN